MRKSEAPTFPRGLRISAALCQLSYPGPWGREQGSNLQLRLRRSFNVFAGCPPWLAASQPFGLVEHSACLPEAPLAQCHARRIPFGSGFPLPPAHEQIEFERT